MIKYKYFQAPEEEMSFLIKEDRKCDLCGKTGRCFELHYAIYNMAARIMVNTL